MLTGTAPITAVRSILMSSFPRSRRSALTWSARGCSFGGADSGAPAASVDPLILQDKEGSIAYWRQCSRYSAS